MKANETLDGVTAGFIAAVANAISRGISMERMKELLADNGKLQNLLLPLIDDDWQYMQSACLRQNGYKGECEKTVWFSLNNASSSNPPTMRAIMAEAYSRKYAPMSEVAAKKLADLFHWNNRSRGYGIFPYLLGEKLMVYKREGGQLYNRQVDLDPDLIDDALLGVPCFFVQGFDDGSNCFKC